MLYKSAILAGVVQLCLFVAALGKTLLGWPSVMPNHVYRAYNSNPGVCFWLALSTIGLLVCLKRLPKMTAERREFVAGYAWSVAVACFCIGLASDDGMVFIGLSGLNMTLFWAIRSEPNLSSEELACIRDSSSSIE